MDSANEPQALPGEQKVSGDANTDDPQPFQWPKASNVYEGTDSDSDEAITSGATARPNPMQIVGPVEALPSIEFEDCLLRKGQLCKDGESFCPWQTVKTYPYLNIGNTNRSKVAEEFFDLGKVYERSWDFFYLYRSTKVDPNQSPFILVPTKQLEHLLDCINRTLNINLSVKTEEDSRFKVTFEDDGTPRPRYLGRANNKVMAESLRNGCPPSYFKLDDEESADGGPSQRSLTAFKGKIDMMARAQKGKKAANKEKQKVARIALQQSWNHSIKRVQRYLGIREAGHEKQMQAIRSGLQNAGLVWKDYDAAVQAAAAKLRPATDFNTDRLASYAQEGSVVFVCIDIEANERNASQVTEIGIATLDTGDLQKLIPGKGGVTWMDAIRSRHFRINEYKHINNTEFVHGCADRFEFGTSEFIDLKDAPHIISTCFKPPFSKPDGLPASEDAPKRNIVLVGHDVGADITYLQKIGYDIYNLSNLLEIVDTASMWRVLKRDTNPRNLGAVLAELDITGWNLHNAGNDAAYTLQAMIGIAIKHVIDQQKRKGVKDSEARERVAQSVKEATLAAWEKEEGWSSAGENSDGGSPISPCPPTPAAKKPSRRNPESSTQAQGPWKSSAPASNNSGWEAPTGFGGPLTAADSWEGSVQPGAAKPRVDFSQNHANLEELMKKSKLSESDKPGW